MFIYPLTVNEDHLTGSFFGLMKLLPPSILLAPFIEYLQRRVPQLQIMPQHPNRGKVQLWPSFEIPKKWQENFAQLGEFGEEKRRKVRIIPDVVLLFDDYVFFVEAERSHSVEAEQLFQQYVLGRHVFLPLKKDYFLILLNTDQIKPFHCRIDLPTLGIFYDDSIYDYIVKRSDMIEEKIDIDDVKRHLLWLSWHHIGDFCETLMNKFAGKADRASTIIFNLLHDLFTLMSMKGYHAIKFYDTEDDDILIESSDVLNIPEWLEIISLRLDDLFNTINPLYILRFPLFQFGIDQFEEIDYRTIPNIAVFQDTTEYLCGLNIEPTIIDIPY